MVVDLELYFNDSLDINNFIAKGKVKEMKGIINDDLSLQDTSFNFFADTSDILIKNIKSKTDIFSIKDGDLQINRDNEIAIKLPQNKPISIKNNALYKNTFLTIRFVAPIVFKIPIKAVLSKIRIKIAVTIFTEPTIIIRSKINQTLISCNCSQSNI